MTYSTDFTLLRSLIGNPTMRCIKDKSEWTSVEDGYSYDADYDAFVNEDGDVWTPTTADLEYDDVAILPSFGSVDIELITGGLSDTGRREVRILPASKTTVENCQFILLDSIEYVLRRCTPFPSGAAMWYAVELEKR